MPSASPSPGKRPSLTDRNSSTHSLSSSGRQATTTHKVHRPHVVNRHSRNVSHGKGLSKLGKVHSTASINTDHHNHQRKRSGGTSPPHSPRTPLVKRNSSHVTLVKNTSFGNLRKNHSATALPRNTSHGALKKIGLPPAARRKSKEAKDGVFQLGDRSSDDEEEGEWEDSTTQSPEVTRNNSKTSTPTRAHTPNEEQNVQRPRAQEIPRTEKTSSPPAASLKNKNRSAPNLNNDLGITQSQNPPDPALLQQYPRSSRAPPAMSTVSAHVGPSQLVRNDSSRSFTHISHADAPSANANPGTTGLTPMSSKLAPSSSGAVSGPLIPSSSVEGGVSHFLQTDTPTGSFRHIADESDDDSPSNFMSNYKPQPSESPEKTKTLHKARSSQNPSRTQQKLELQRREMLRAGAATPTTPPPTGMGLALGSTAPLHGRAASRNRNRSLAGEIKAVKQDYENAVKQFMVVRRFRSPMIEGLGRLKEKGSLPQDVGVVATGGNFSKSRPQSRRGPSSTGVNGHAKTGASRSFEEQKTSPLVSRSNSRGHGGRVHFQRHSSHDDIEVTPSQGGLDGTQDDEQFGLSPEEALIRRIWESREVYEPGDLGQDCQ